MGRYFAICMLPFLLLWSASKWRAMRHAKSPREKSFIARVSIAGWIWAALLILILSAVTGKWQIVLAGVFLFIGLSFRRATRLYHEKLRAEEADPLLKAKRVN